MSLAPTDRPQRASSTAVIIASRVASQPTTARRGVPSGDGATSACTSTSTGRVPSMPANTAAPPWRRGLFARLVRLLRIADRAVGEEQGRRVRHLGEPAVAHLEHADLVGRAEAVLDGAQDAELVAALALEIEHRVDHVLEHARAGDQPFLGDMADQHDSTKPRRLARPISSCAAPRTWLTVPGALSSVSRYIVWIEFDRRRGRGRVPLSSAATMSRTLLAAASRTGASATPSRSARSRTWSIASSPVM